MLLTATAYKKGNSEVLELFSAGLAILINTGVQQKLYAKWLGDGDGSMSSWTLQPTGNRRPLHAPGVLSARQ
jgi:hypothetical protein